MWTMGDDFQYQYAETWFKQMDKLIHYVNLVSYIYIEEKTLGILCEVVNIIHIGDLYYHDIITENISFSSNRFDSLYVLHNCVKT